MRNRSKSKAEAQREAQEAIRQGRKWLLEHEAAGYLGIAPFTLQRWRLAGKTTRGEIPPRAYKRCSQTYYRVDELDQWIEQGLVGGKNND